MELTRLFIPIDTNRFASRETVFKGQNGSVNFPANTMFHILGRRIRMNPELYPKSTEFNPDRFLENGIKMNSIQLCPFGIGPRQCPASGTFTK